MAQRQMIVELHFRGIFSRYPIRYTEGIEQEFGDVDFAAMDRVECYAFVERYTQEKCEKLYYCLPEVSFPAGLRLIESDVDYADFIQVGYDSGCVIPMYVDHFGATNMKEWLEEETDSIVDDLELSEDVDDDDVIASPPNLSRAEDPFLTKLCPKRRAIPQSRNEEGVDSDDGMDLEDMDEVEELATVETLYNPDTCSVTMLLLMDFNSVSKKMIVEGF